MDRRTFARTVAAVLAGLGLPAHGWGASTLPTRRLGRTGLQVPILALGGHHVGRAASEADARLLVETAFEQMTGGVDVLDALIAGRELPTERVVRYGAQIADALFAVHPTPFCGTDF